MQILASTGLPYELFCRGPNEISFTFISVNMSCGFSSLFMLHKRGNSITILRGVAFVPRIHYIGKYTVVTKRLSRLVEVSNRMQTDSHLKAAV